MFFFWFALIEFNFGFAYNLLLSVLITLYNLLHNVFYILYVTLNILKELNRYKFYVLQNI